MKLKIFLLTICSLAFFTSSVFAQTYPECKPGFYTWPSGCVLKNQTSSCNNTYLCQKVTEGIFVYCCDPNAVPAPLPSQPAATNSQPTSQSTTPASNPLRPNPFDLVPEEAQKTFSASKDEMTVGVAEGPDFAGFPRAVISSFYRFITPFLSPGKGVSGSPGGPGGPPTNPLGQWLVWPSADHSPGYYTSCYGKRCWENADGSLHVGNHAGIDIAYGDGAGIYAAAPGVVHAAGFDSVFGYHVIIDHQNGWYTIYGHMQPNLLVSTGQTITVNTTLGYQDSSGDVYPPPSTACPTCGTHLHLGLSQGGNTTDFFMASGITLDPCSALPNCVCDPNQYNGLDHCPANN